MTWEEADRWKGVVTLMESEDIHDWGRCWKNSLLIIENNLIFYFFVNVGNNYIYLHDNSIKNSCITNSEESLGDHVPVEKPDTKASVDWWEHQWVGHILLQALLGLATGTSGIAICGKHVNLSLIGGTQEHLSVSSLLELKDPQQKRT